MPKFAAFPVEADTGSTPNSMQESPFPLLIQERELSQNEFEQLLAQSNPPLAQGFKSIGRKIKEAMKSALSVTVGAFKDLGSVVVGEVKKVVQVLVTTYENVADKVGEVIKKVENFIIDTAEKATAFVEGIVEKIGVAVTKMVEFLRALFNWKDILSTQRYLANAVEEGLRYAVKLADAARAKADAAKADVAKNPVKAFMADLRETVQDNLDATIKNLGGDESDLQKSGIELPEELEWFLSKLMSGLNRSSPDSLNNISNPASSSDPLEEFVSNLLKKFERISKIMFRNLEGLGEAITKLITNPYRPQVALIAILKVVRDVMDEFLALLEDIAIDFLNIIGFMVEKLRELITMEINIPFVTAFFKMIGAGKLNALNLTSLMAAIPITIFGQKPFENEPALALSYREKLARDFKITGLVMRGVKTLTVDAWPTVAKVRGFGKWVKLTSSIKILLNITIWLGSFPASPVPGWKGGYPYNIADNLHKVSKSNPEDMYWQRVVWVWRSSMLATNTLIDLVSIGDNAFNNEALKEEFDDSYKMFRGIVSCVDVILTSVYVDKITAKTEKEKQIKQSSQIIRTLPGPTEFLKLSRFKPYEVKLSKVLYVITICCAGTVIGLESDLLINS